MMDDAEPACGVNWSRTSGRFIHSHPVTFNDARPSIAAPRGDATFSRYARHVS